MKLTAIGGVTSYTFALSSGSLPPGIVLDPDGTLHGTPVTPGTYIFTVTVNDANGCPGRREYRIIILNCPPITLSPAGALQAAVVNTPYSQTFTATGGCGSAFTYSMTNGSLPPGLTLASNGLLSGTTMQGGDYSFTVTATDACGCSQAKDYTLRAQSEENKVQTKELVISAFRENGPKGSGDEFVEIFNPSKDPITIGTLTGVSSAGIGVFSNAGNNAGTAGNGVTLRCQIPSVTVIRGRGWFLCGGSEYSLSNLGIKGGTFHSVPDATILGDIPNDAGLALLNVGPTTLPPAHSTQRIARRVSNHQAVTRRFSIKLASSHTAQARRFQTVTLPWRRTIAKANASSQSVTPAQIRLQRQRVQNQCSKRGQRFLLRPVNSLARFLFVTVNPVNTRLVVAARLSNLKPAPEVCIATPITMQTISSCSHQIQPAILARP